jgi:hypothetical protein
MPCRPRGQKTTDTADWSVIAEQFTELIDANAVDPAFRNCVPPHSTTTTKSAPAMESTIMMAICKNYFNFSTSFMCGAHVPQSPALAKTGSTLSIASASPSPTQR